MEVLLRGVSITSGWSINGIFSCHCIRKGLLQGWATLGTRALLSGTWARPRKRDPPPFNVSVSSISFVNNRLFNLTLMCFWCHMATHRAVSAALRTPKSQGPKIQTPHHKLWLARGRILSLILPISARKPTKVARPWRITFLSGTLNHGTEPYVYCLLYRDHI